ncbi:MAG: hypothetical protein WC745_00680 [Patescibacteria group bacterium]|jgi:uncharacterized SAM-binding protein YcdF (DUF218 family)
MAERQFEYHDREYQASRHEYVERIRKIVERGLPRPKPDWNMVWVLGGPEEKFEDPGEDRQINQTKNRFETGIDIAKMVAKLRAGETSNNAKLPDITNLYPHIYFNGRDEQNDYIRKMISEKVFEEKYSFPSEKIIVSPNQGIKHTGDQFSLFPKEYMPDKGKLVTVTDLYHIPRVEKYFKKYLIDHEKIVMYQATPTILPVQRALSEAKKIFPYLQQGIL